MRGELRLLITNWRNELWIILLLISFAGIADIPATTILNTSVVCRWVIVVCIAALKATSLTALVLVSSSSKLLRLIIWILVGLYALICLINGIAYYFYNLGITNKLLTIVSQTNSFEVKEFFVSFGVKIIETFQRPYIYAVISVITLGWIFLRKFSGKLILIIASVMSLIGAVSLVIIIISQGSGRAVFSPVLRLAKSLVQARDEVLQINSIMAKVTPLPDEKSVSSFQVTDVIMVVGESASRNMLSLYGFALNTSPKLYDIKDSLFVFEDVIGTSTITAYNMNRILTFLKDNDDAENWYKSPALYSVIKKAGYHTWWLSNQERSGMWGNSTAALVASADETKFVGSTSSDDSTLQEYDEILLPEIEEALAYSDKAKFIGVHLMGSHIEYRRRYPDTFKVFDADSILKLDEYKSLSRSHATTVAQYCNSLVYTDYILSRVIRMVSELDRPTVVFYFSDHGENVYDGGENYCGRDANHVKVPFVVYTNPAFAQRNIELYERIKHAVHKPMTTAEVVHALCSVTGTHYAAYVDSLDVLSPNFKSRNRYVDGNVWYENLN